MTAPRITAEEIAEYRQIAIAPVEVGGMPWLHKLLDALESAYAELDRLSAQDGEVPELTEEPVVVEDFADNGAHSQWRLVIPSTNTTLWEEATARPAPPHPDTVEVSKEVYRWVPVGESLPEDQERIGFIVDCGRDDFLHGRVYGGSFNRRDWDERWGGFNTHGFGARASHWCRLPPIPDAIRSGAQAQPATEREGT